MTIKLNKPRTIIQELGELVPVKNKHTVIEARAIHVITSAVNLMEQIRANYDADQADDLCKRLLRSIQLSETDKFTRKIKHIRKAESHGKK
jgi:hypothetical protein